MRFTYAESMIEPSSTCRWPVRGRRRLRHHGRPRQHLLPGGVRVGLPFNEDGSREFLEDKPFIEPFTLIPAMGR